MILIISLPCSLLENIFAAGGDDCPQRLYDNKCTESHCTALVKSSNSTSSQSDQFDQIIPKVQETQTQCGAICTGYINLAFDEADPSESDTVSLPKENHAVRPLQNDSGTLTKFVDHLLMWLLSIQVYNHLTSKH